MIKELVDWKLHEEFGDEYNEDPELAAIERASKEEYVRELLDGSCDDADEYYDSLDPVERCMMYRLSDLKGYKSEDGRRLLDVLARDIEIYMHGGFITIWLANPIHLPAADDYDVCAYDGTVFCR